jgi:hypothetical protein
MENLNEIELRFIFKLVTNELTEQKFSPDKDNDLNYINEVKELSDKIWEQIKTK